MSHGAQDGQDGQDDQDDQDDHAGPVLVFHDRIADYSPATPVSHTEHGLTYLVDGWFRMEHGGPIEARAGSFTVVPAGVPHRALAGRDMEYWLLGFCPTCLGLDEGQPLLSPFRRVRHGALPVLDVAEARQAKVVEFYGALREELTRGLPETPELVKSLVLLLLGEACRALPGDEVQGLGGSLVGDALEFIQRHGLEPISLRDVAKAVHRTPTHVANVVKEETGYSVGAWITAGRVSEAAARLAHTNDALEDVAQHVGWRDKTHLIRQFKKAYGVTPAAWRRAHRGGHDGETAAHRMRRAVPAPLGRPW